MVQKFKNFYHLLNAWYWAWRCGWPGKKLYVIGVTGTDGKTTTCTLIYEILKAAGLKADYITTVNSEGLHTTNPDPSLLQPLLKKMVEKGMTHCVLEVTSHGLDQNRVMGIDFQIGVLTNITHEHLDYHGTMEKYIEAKSKLFKYVKYAVLPNFQFEILNLKSNPNVKIFKYRKSKIKNVSMALVGDYNLYNLAAATEVARILGIEKWVKLVARSFSGVGGRREEVPNKKGFRVFVDFAHTPNALENVLTQLRKETKNRLICVFGCTGERDKEKRPIMGEIAARIADFVIITSDDTRSENQDEIARQIIDGMSNAPGLRATPSLIKEGEGGVFKINDRKKALQKALGMARKGDIVLLAGKGHEKTILHGTTEYPWNDFDEAVKILNYAKN